MTTIRRRYELTDQEWNRIKDYFPQQTKGRPHNNIRTTINGILWIARTGAPWRDLPERYGQWNTVYKAFAKWQEQNIFETIFTELGVDADMQNLSIHSTGAKKTP